MRAKRQRPVVPAQSWIRLASPRGIYTSRNLSSIGFLIFCPVEFPWKFEYELAAEMGQAAKRGGLVRSVQAGVFEIGEYFIHNPAMGKGSRAFN